MYLIVSFLPHIISQRVAESPGTAGHCAGARPCGRAATMGTMGQPIQWSLRGKGKEGFGGKSERKSLQRQREGKLWTMVWVVGTGAEEGCRAVQPASERARLRIPGCSSSKTHRETYLT